MIKFSTSNGTYLSIPGNTPEDLELASVLIPMSIDHEKRILAEKARQVCNVLSAVVVGREAREGGG